MREGREIAPNGSGTLFKRIKNKDHLTQQSAAASAYDLQGICKGFLSAIAGHSQDGLIKAPVINNLLKLQFPSQPFELKSFIAHSHERTLVHRVYIPEIETWTTIGGYYKYTELYAVFIYETRNNNNLLIMDKKWPCLPCPFIGCNWKSPPMKTAPPTKAHSEFFKHFQTCPYRLSSSQHEVKVHCQFSMKCNIVGAHSGGESFLCIPHSTSVVKNHLEIFPTSFKRSATNSIRILELSDSLWYDIIGLIHFHRKKTITKKSCDYCKKKIPPHWVASFHHFIECAKRKERSQMAIEFHCINERCNKVDLSLRKTHKCGKMEDKSAKADVPNGNPILETRVSLSEAEVHWIAGQCKIHATGWKDIFIDELGAYADMETIAYYIGAYHGRNSANLLCPMAACNYRYKSLFDLMEHFLECKVRRANKAMQIEPCDMPIRSHIKRHHH